MFQDDMAVIDRVILKARHVAIPERLQKQALEQLNINHMGIKKIKLLVHESINGMGTWSYILSLNRKGSDKCHIHNTQHTRG